MSNGGRRAELDGVRGIAILLVLVGHADEKHFAPLAAAGVTLFFALSGYLITGLLLTEHGRRGRLNLRRFYARRMTRLAPPLFVMLAVVVPVLGIPWQQVVGPAAWLGNYARLVGYVPHAIEHTWSLGVEEQFYLLWPAALLLLLRRRNRAAILTGIVGVLLAWRLVLTVNGQIEYAYYAFEAAATGLLVGALVALVPQTRHYLAFVALWSVGVGTLLARITEGEAFALSVPLLVAPACGLLVAHAGRLRWLSWRPLAFCGVASYSIYLWHVPVAWLVGGDHTGPVGVLVGTAVGLVAWAVVERPLMAWRDGRKAPVSVVPVAPEAALLR